MLFGTVDGHGHLLKSPIHSKYTRPLITVTAVTAHITARTPIWRRPAQVTAVRRQMASVCARQPLTGHSAKSVPIIGLFSSYNRSLFLPIIGLIRLFWKACALFDTYFRRQRDIVGGKVTY